MTGGRVLSLKLTPMAAGAAAAADEESSSPSSPKNRLKFLCSYGGKILPRPSDGHLKYVGGDTRVLVVPRSISFSELKGKVQGMFHRCEVIKYQLMSEDLDTLVTVTNDEDLAHVLDEYDRIDALHPRSPSSASSPRFRLFLFTALARSSPSASYPAAAPLDQRYVDAINTAGPCSPRRPTFTISASSAVTSPTSTIDGPAAFFALRANAPVFGGGGGMHRVQSTPNLGGGGMYRVRSSPNLGGGGLPNQMSNSGAALQHLHFHHHHPPQHHLLHRQQTPGARAHGSQAAGGAGAWWVGGTQRYEAYGSGAQWPPQPPARGGLHYSGGGGVCFPHAEESSSARASRSSSPFRALPR